MDISNQISGQEMLKLQSQVDSFNKALQQDGRKAQQELGKDDFLKLLITQLQNQDPTNPMKDKEFIAQMAQFSSLEQMNNMSEQFSKLSGKLQSGQAMNTLGKHVEVSTETGPVSGTVSEIRMGEFPQVMVKGTFYDYGQVQRITETE
jgi:flagellar basal-body rod modification protein FlgD